RLVLRIRPGLDAYGAAMTAAELQRRVAGAEYVGRRGAPAGIDGDPAGRRQTETFRHGGDRLDADAHQHQIGRDLRAIAEADTIRRASAHGRAEDELDAMAAVPCRNQIADDGRERAREQPLLAFDDGDATAVLRRSAGRFKSDHAAADDYDARFFVDRFAKPQRVL